MLDGLFTHLLYDIQDSIYTLTRVNVRDNTLLVKNQLRVRVKPTNY